MPARQLLPVPVTTGPAALDLLPMLTAALAGSGPALLPHLPGHLPRVLPAPATGTAGDGTAGDGAVPLPPSADDPANPTAAVVATSGSGGAAHGVLLDASALLASASATHDRLGGGGQWLLALPVHHVAGLQVLVRSLVTGTAPAVVDLTGGFTPQAFAAAVGTMGRARRYTALVPTQLARLLAAGGRARAALASLDAVLIGGAYLAPALRRRAEAAGVRIVGTYGMTETCGGCVYDGRPLDGVEVRVTESGRIELTGPVLARGYLDAPSPFVTTGGVRTLPTRDLGAWDGDRLLVRGRLDDAVTTGGLTVWPQAVESAVLTLPEIAEAVVVGVPDAAWGERLVAAVVLRPGAAAPSLDRLRAAVAEVLEPGAAPRDLLVLDTLPLRGVGKPDRTAVAELARRPR